MGSEVLNLPGISFSPQNIMPMDGLSLILFSPKRIRLLSLPPGGVPRSLGGVVEGGQAQGPGLAPAARGRNGPTVRSAVVPSQMIQCNKPLPPPMSLACGPGAKPHGP